MSLGNRLENAPSHTSLIRASKATNRYLDGTFAMSFLAVEIKLFQSTLEPEIAANKENMCIAK